MSSLLQREITRIELCERLWGRSFSCLLQCLADDGVRQMLHLHFVHVEVCEPTIRDSFQVLSHIYMCVCVLPKMAAPQP